MKKTIDAENLYYNGQKLNIDQAKKKYNQIRDKYVVLADEARIKFEYYYVENYADIDDVVDLVQNKAKEIIESYFEDTFFDIFENKLEKEHKSQFIDDYYKKGYYTFDDEFAKVNSKFISIEQKRMKKDKEIEQMYKNEENLNKDDEENIQKKIYKIAKGAVNSTKTVINKTGNSFEELNEKKILFENTNTLFTLSKGVYDSVLNIHLELVDYLNINQKEDIKKYTKEEIERSENLFENAKLRNKGKEDFARNMLNAIEVYPYNEKIYRYIIRNFYDENKEIENIANYFSVPVQEFKEQLLFDNVGTLDIKDEKSANETMEKIEKNARLLGIDIVTLRQIKDIDDVYEAVKKFDLIYRTVNDIEFETRQQADLAKWEKSKIQDILKTTSYEDEQDLILAREKIEKSGFKTKIQESYLTDIKARIVSMDLKYRTVNGIEFKTRDQADLARDEKKQIEKIIESKNLLSIEDIQDALYDIQKLDLKCDLQNDYIEKLNSRRQKLKKVNETASTISQGAKAIGKKISDLFKG